MKKVSLISLAALLAVIMLLAGCVPSKNTPDNAASPASTASGNSNSEGPTTISIFTPKFSDNDFDNNEFTKLVEQKLNIKIDWVYSNQDASKEQRQLSLASGEYADSFFLVTWLDNISKTEAQKYGKDGVYLPLNDLIKNYAPNIQKALTDIPYLSKSITAPDGNIYGLPLVGECYHCSINGKMWINTQWLKNLNLQMPTTTEEYKKVLEAFKNDDPNQNGKKDEIPLSGESKVVGDNPIQFLMNAFIPDNGKDYLNVDNGKLSLAAMQPQWKDGLAYVASLYKEGLIDPGAFTQNTDAFKQIGTPAGDSILGSSAAAHSAIFVDLNTDKAKNYDAVPPLKGPNGAQFTTSDFGNANYFAFAITNKADEKQAEALIKLADYLYSEEGTLLSTKGKEGVNWRKGAAGDVDLNGDQAKYAAIPDDPNVKPEDKVYYGWGERGPLLMTRSFRDTFAAAVDETTPDGYERKLYNATKKYDGFQPKEQFVSEGAWVDPADSEEVNLLKININKYIEENMVAFVTGSKDINKDWNSYLEGFKNLQVDRYLEIYQKAYDAVK